MKRRSLLTGVGSSLYFLAGCTTNSQSSPPSTPTPDSTPPPEITTITETKPLPTPNDVSTSTGARSFVETHERRFVYNELVGGFGSSGGATDISVEQPTAAIVHTTRYGYYLLSTCRGSARYYDPDGSPSGASRNASSVAHFVGGDTHRRIPFNAYRCEPPVVPLPDEDGSVATATRFQLYDFQTPPDYEQPTRGGNKVDVAIHNDEGTDVLDRTYQTSLPLTVQPRVAETPGSYRLSVSLDGGEETVHYDWFVSSTIDSSWWALAVIITNRGGVVVDTFSPNESVGLPSSSLCTRQ